MRPMRGRSGAIALFCILTTLVLSSCLDNGNDPVPDEPLAVADIAGNWQLAETKFTSVESGESVSFPVDPLFIDESLDITEEGHYTMERVQALVDTLGVIVGDTTLFDSGIMGVQNDKMIVIPDDPQTSSLSPQQTFVFFLYEHNDGELAMSFFFQFPFDIDGDGVTELVTTSRVYR